MTLAILFFDGLRQFIYSAIIGGIIWDFIKRVLIIFYKLVKKAIKNFRLYSKHTHSFRLPVDACARFLYILCMPIFHAWIKKIIVMIASCFCAFSID
jgi:hypothetical protein